MGSRFSAKQQVLMQAVELLRQRFPTNRETLEELAAIADRIERLAAFADHSKSITSMAGRGSAEPRAEPGGGSRCQRAARTEMD